ncbi:MAG: histidine phosphatase family protein [Acidimicrobiia bacterium]
MTSFLIVRHGESTWNVEGRWQGQADPPLTELGERQAAAAAHAVGAVDAVVASDLQRAAHTAAIIANALGVGPVLVDPRVRERHAGEWQGLTRDEIDVRFPGWLQEKKRPEGFEHDEPVVARAMGLLDELAATYEDAAVLVITHGGLIRALERHLTDEAGMVPNLGGIAVEHDGTRVRMVERVLLIDADEIEITIPGQI